MTRHDVLTDENQEDSKAGQNSEIYASNNRPALKYIIYPLLFIIVVIILLITLFMYGISSMIPSSAEVLRLLTIIQSLFVGIVLALIIILLVLPEQIWKEKEPMPAEEAVTENFESDLCHYENELSFYKRSDDSDSRNDNWGKQCERLKELIEQEIDIANKELKQAKTAAKKPENLNFLRHFYRASRQEVFIVDLFDRLENCSPKPTLRSLGKGEHKMDKNSGKNNRNKNDCETNEKVSHSRLHAFAQRISSQVDSLPPGRRKERIRNILYDSNGSLQSELEAGEIDTALRLLYEEYRTNYESIVIIREMVKKLTRHLIIILLVGLFISLSISILAALGLFPPIQNPEPSRYLYFPLLYGFVVLFGTFGSVVSNLTKFYNLSADVGTRIPDEVFQITDEIVLARIVLGGAAAAIIYIVFLAGIPTRSIRNTSEATFFILVLSFAAGFSDRLLIKAIDMVENQVIP